MHLGGGRTVSRLLSRNGKNCRRGKTNSGLASLLNLNETPSQNPVLEALAEAAQGAGVTIGEGEEHPGEGDPIAPAGAEAEATAEVLTQLHPGVLEVKIEAAQQAGGFQEGIQGDRNQTHFKQANPPITTI